ncbi:MAG: isocitrate lyase/PEP mutase family protein [Acidimicrobiales bacterium]
MATSQKEKAERFRALHEGPDPLLLANPWDPGSAKILTALGYRALATTSGGSAAALGKLDGQITRDEALTHAAAVVAATDLPVSADLERGFADRPEGVAATIRDALATGLAGGSIEDSTAQGPKGSIYDLALAAERVAAAAEVAHGGDAQFVLTGRCENYLHGRPDLAETIARLQAYQEAGADVLFAPGVSDADDIRQIVVSVDRPVNVLVVPGVPPVAELAALGVARISIGGAFAYAALSALVAAAREFKDQGTYGFAGTIRTGLLAAREAFGA